MRQSGDALRRPVADLESQYQHALNHNATFDPTEQYTSAPRVPPTLHHVPVHEDPQRFYDINAASYAPSASETFVFGTWSVSPSQFSARLCLSSLAHSMPRRVWRRVDTGHALAAATARRVTRVCPERLPLRRAQLDELAGGFPNGRRERSRDGSGLGGAHHRSMARRSERPTARQRIPIELT